MLRVIPNRTNKNLLVVFDHSVLPTNIAADAVTALLRRSDYETKGEHTIYLVDGMTGETSNQVIFKSR